MKQLIATVTMLGLLTLTALLGVDAIYRKVAHRPFEIPRNLFIAAEIPNKYQLVAVGNSHADAAFDFSHYNIRSLKLSGVAQRFSYDLALLKQNHNRIEDGAVVLITVTPISFSHRKADQNDGLQFNYYGVLSPLLIPDLLIGDYIQQEIAPFIRSGPLLRSWYKEQVDTRIAEEERWIDPNAQLTDQNTTNPYAIPVQDVPYNVQFISNELEHHSPIESAKYIDNMNFIFHKWYETDEFGPEYFSQNRKDLESLIAYCNSQGWRPIVITIPITQVLQEGLLDDYMHTYLYQNLEQIDAQGTAYWDYSHNSELSSDLYLFDNADHLSKIGGAAFSYLLMRDLITQSYLPPSVDGYDYGPLYADSVN